MERLKKITVGFVSILLIFGAYEVSPAYTVTTPKTVISTTITTTEILGEKATITVHRYDTFPDHQHLVAFTASCEINGSLLLKVITDEYPLDKLENPFLSVSSGEICSIPEEWKELWDNIWFVKAPGPPEIYVKYNHPNNLPPPDGEYHPGEVNIDYELQGTNKLHHHVARWRVEKDLREATLTSVIGGVMDVVAVLLKIPEYKVTKVAAAVIGIIGAILAAAGLAKTWFISNVIQTEMGDGWEYTWGYGSWWIFRWWKQSFGAWRDVGFTFIAFAESGNVECAAADREGRYLIDWWNPFQTRPITIWYIYDQRRNRVEPEIKCASTSATVR